MEIKPVDPEFVRVWSRVAPTHEENPTAATADTAFPSGKLRAEQERFRLYRKLGLTIPARESALRAKGLRTALFFAGAEPTPPPSSATHYANRAEALRQLYLAEGLSEQDYRAAAQQCNDVMLTKLYYACAESCAKVRQYLWNLVEGK